MSMLARLGTRIWRLALLPVTLSCGLSGCAVFSAYNASPFPHDYDKDMDEGSVRWLASKPTIDLARYGDQSLRPHQRLPDVDFVLSVSGGGQRAAALALGTMLALEQDLGVGAGNALLEVDAISSVSGGGWAVGGYLAARYRHQQDRASTPFVLAQEIDTVRRGLRGLRNTVFDRCLQRRMEMHVTCVEASAVCAGDGRSLLLGDIFVPAGQVPTLPYALANSAVADDASAFVFTPGYMRYFDVQRFRMTQCAASDYVRVGGVAEAVPYSIGLTASSSIPPGRHVSLELGLCDPGSAHPLRDTHLCASGRRYLHLIDGGFIDNLGYRTAVEALRTGPAARHRKVLLVVDSSADDHVPLSDDADPSTLITLGGAVKNIGNGAYAAFHQLAEKWASLNGVELVVLGAAELVESIGQTLPASDPRMAGLSMLRQHEDRELGAICVNGQCDVLKIYALIKKTAASYSIEDDTQRLLIDIGRLLARVRAEEICSALTGTAPQPRLADGQGRLRCLP